MFPDTSFNFRDSLASGPRDPATRFPRLVVFPPPEFDDTADGGHPPPDWLDSLSFDDGKVSMANHGDSNPLTPQTSPNLYHNVQQLPYQHELSFALCSPTWSTTESDFGSPAYTLPSTPGTFYPTPVLASQSPHPYHTHSSIPPQQSMTEESTINPTQSRWMLPATIAASSATATRDVTRDMHATRYGRLQFPLSFGDSASSSAYGTQKTGLQLTLHQPIPLRADTSAPRLLSYGLAVPADATADLMYRFIPCDVGGQSNGTDISLKREETKDDTQYMTSSSEPATKPRSSACSHCSRAFGRKQDLTRHMKTVHGEGKQWVCCGVPMSEAHKHRISADAVKIGSMEHGGILMIGGCGREFGRKDTYAKHLKSVRTRCVGDVDALYHVENMMKVLRFRAAKGRASRK